MGKNRLEILRKSSYLTTFFRGLSAFYTIFNPVVGIMSYMILDFLDARILRDLLRMSRNDYQIWDKKVDILGYFFMFIGSISSGQWLLLLPLFLYRLVGNILFIRTKNEHFLVYFPDFLTLAFIWTIFQKVLGWPIFFLIFPVKIMYEYFDHWYWPRHLASLESKN